MLLLSEYCLDPIPPNGGGGRKGFWTCNARRCALFFLFTTSRRHGRRRRGRRHSGAPYSAVGIRVQKGKGPSHVEGKSRTGCRG